MVVVYFCIVVVYICLFYSVSLDCSVLSLHGLWIISACGWFISAQWRYYVLCGPDVANINCLTIPLDIWHRNLRTVQN